MKNKENLLYFTLFLIFCQLIFNSSGIFVQANGETPENYYKNLNLNTHYVYNISKFGGSAGWYNMTAYPDPSYEGDFKTESGGQIKINLTGFYDKHPNDATPYEEPIPWMDIEILTTNLETNFTLSNRSNTEISRNLILGYNSFQPGFLIPISNLTISEIYAEQATEGFVKGDVIIEKSYHFFSLDFKADDNSQKTSLIYEQKSGLLVWAYTNAFGFELEISSLNFSLDFNNTFNYSVNDFLDQPAYWYDYNPKGYYETSPGGLITINFTGYFDRFENDTGDVFPEKIPYYDIKIYDITEGSLHLNFTQLNISNKEVAFALILGYNDFQSGFLIPEMDNITKIKQLAIQEESGFISGDVDIQETNLTLRITFSQDEGSQKNEMIYEKKTGLLLYSKTSLSYFLLEFVIEDYDPDLSRSNNIIPSKNFLEEIFPYLIIGSISVMSFSVILIASKYNNYIQKYNKYGIIAIIAIASFSSLLIYATSISTPETNTPEDYISDIDLIVDYGNGTIKIKENFELDNYETTAFDALNKWCVVQYTDYGESGYLIESIDYKEGNWIYLINGESISTASNKYNLKSGDTVKWSFKS